MEALAKLWQWPGSELKQILLTIEELFSTSIRFAFEDESMHQVVFHISMTESAIMLEMIDDGIPFNPMEYNPDLQTDPAALDEGGMGLMLIKAFTDSYQYRREGHKNHLLIEKRVKTKFEEND